MFGRLGRRVPSTRMWKQVHSMIAKRMKRIRVARLGLQGGAGHQQKSMYTRENMAIPDMALPVVQVGVSPDGIYDGLYWNRIHMECHMTQGDEARQMAERVQSRRLKRLRSLSTSINSGRSFAFMRPSNRVRPQRNSDPEVDKVWLRLPTICLQAKGYKCLRCRFIHRAQSSTRIRN
jgi:hypothetical protein